jgi:ribosome-binding protein aMBF1 (putative translation factor)
LRSEPASKIQGYLSVRGYSNTRIMAWVTGRSHRVNSGEESGVYPEQRRAVELGRSARKLRERHGLSQLQVARAAGMQFSAVKRFESGEYLPSLPVLERIARALGVCLDIRLR